MAAALRLADLLGALSLATDLGNGMPAEDGLRIAILASRLVQGEPVSVRAEIFWTGVLRYLGCNGYAVEEAAFASGDDIGLRRSFVQHDLGRPSQFLHAVLNDVGRGAPLAQRLRGVTRLLTSPGAPAAHAHAQCDAAVHCGRKLLMPAAVIDALADGDERFDGGGQPQGKAGDALPLAQRCVEVARIAVVFHALGGETAAVAELQRRAGGHLDPAIVQRFVGDAAALCRGLGAASVWDDYLACEPGLWLLDEASLMPLFDAFALVADLKSGYLAGHSQGVAALVVAAAQIHGLGPDQAAQIGRAALLHDLGRVAVATGVWDKPGALNAAEWERVHLHSYYTDRVLRRSPALATYAEMAGRTHERLDGSGYHRGERGREHRLDTHRDTHGDPSLDAAPRLLAAADVYRACTEDRAHRVALTAAQARAVLDDGVRHGRLCRQAANAVLAAAGQAPARPAAATAGELSPREVDVLRLVVRGLSNKQVAQALAISPRTVQHHTIHIYAKTGVKSRAGAALWAVEQGLFR